MDSFISNNKYNRISRMMKDFQGTLKFSADKVIVEAARELANEEIKALCSGLSEEHVLQMDIALVHKPEDVDNYLNEIKEFTTGMKAITEDQVRKVFKKEKKLKMPPVFECEMKSYYGWIDQGKKKLYVVYWLEKKLIGMVCNINTIEVSNTRLCSICHHMNDNNEVINVSAKCKTANKDSYHEIGFNICRDSDECNRRITSVQPLENLIRKVNGVNN